MDEMMMNEVMDEQVMETAVEAIETIATQPTGKSKLGLIIGIGTGAVTLIGGGIALGKHYYKKNKDKIDEKRAEKLRRKGYKVEKLESETLEPDSVSDTPKK